MSPGLWQAHGGETALGVGSHVHTGQAGRVTLLFLVRVRVCLCWSGLQEIGCLFIDFVWWEAKASEKFR